MRVWIAALLGGLALAPVACGLVLIASYGAFAAAGVTEQEGRRGWYAFGCAMVLGLPIGYGLGFRLGWRFASEGGSSGATGMGVLLALLGFTAALLHTWVAGVRLAERRGIPPPRRNRWAFIFIALPVSGLCGGVAFFLGRLLVA